MSLTVCARMIEDADPDRFAATMAAPPDTRTGLWPLYALNLEVARAAYASDEPMIAEMRLQWWVDQIGWLAEGKAPQGEVAAALQPLVRAYPSICAPLITLIEARRWDCWRDPFADRAALETYLDATAGGLVWAAALTLDAPDTSEPALRDFAFGAGLANWFDAVPALQARGRQPLPDTGLKAIAELAGMGLRRIDQARAARHLVPASIRPVLWPGWSARGRLNAAQRVPERVADGRLPDQPHRRGAALMLRAISGYW
ncbi:MAG: squalene/phytoene synthase family protein [Albidovulum sp.]